jgi:hypothetical protein
MSTNKRREIHRPPELNRDRARPLNAPAPTDLAVEAHLAELVSPATFGLTNYYHRLGKRWRILNLPVMVAMILTMVWRQVPSVSTLTRMVSRQALLWAPPIKVSQQAFAQRLSSLPAALFGEVFATVLPTLLARSTARSRPKPAVVSQTLAHFPHVWIIDATTLEELARKVGLLRESSGKVLAGKLLAILDLPSKLPLHLWLDPDDAVNEKAFLDRIKAVLAPGTLVVFDKGFYAFPFFDWLTDQGVSFITRARSLAAFQVQEELLMSPQRRERIIALGKYRSNPCRHPVRLIEVCVGGTWHQYLSNVLAPALLPGEAVADLYSRRWRIEEAFLLAKRLLGLAYIWNGSYNGIQLQVWASWLLYAVLIDLSDAVAEALDLPLDRISVEMVYRSLYHFCTDQRPDQPREIVAYLAVQDDLGIVKRQRKRHPEIVLDNQPLTLNL